ncbi:MAG: chemotaxis protein CheW [Bryobacterales bacterium]|nr:chemotaxis protein CheW [Bryobacterales bacterium]
MKKRKKNSGRQDDIQQPDMPEAGPDLSGIDISNLSDAELEALTSPQSAAEAEPAVPEVEALAGEAPAEAVVAASGPDEIESIEIPEPEMDELLAELLAQEASMESVDVPVEVPAGIAVEIPFPVEAAAEPVAEASFEQSAPQIAELAATLAAAPVLDTAPLEPEFPEPEMPEVLEFAAAEEPLSADAHALQPEPLEMELLASPALEAPVEALEAALEEAPQPEVPAAAELAPEPAVEAFAAQAREPVEAPIEVELAAEPAPPQPALEAVVRSIDQALESAPAVASVAETAAPVHHHKQFSQLDDYVVFSLAGTDYAVPVRDVAEIGRIPSITRLPNVPDFIRGITNLRGEVVPVLSLPVLLGLQDNPATARGRVLFLQPRERVSSTGLVVDEVKGIQRIQSQQLEQVTGLVDDKVTAVLRGVHGRGDRLLNVLDLEQLFHLQEFQQLESR